MLRKRKDTPQEPRTGHELIHGPIASGKTGLVKVMLDEDIFFDHTETRVVDPFLAVPEYSRRVDQYAQATGDIDELLSSILADTFTRAERAAELGIEDFETNDDRHGLRLVSVTIEAADDVLRGRNRSRMVEQTMRMSRRAGVRFRLVVPDLSLTSFGWSELIRSTMTDASVFACEKASV